MGYQALFVRGASLQGVGLGLMLDNASRGELCGHKKEWYEEWAVVSGIVASRHDREFDIRIPRCG